MNNIIQMHFSNISDTIFTVVLLIIFGICAIISLSKGDDD